MSSLDIPPFTLLHMFPLGYWRNFVRTLLGGLQDTLTDIGLDAVYRLVVVFVFHLDMYFNIYSCFQKSPTCPLDCLELLNDFMGNSFVCYLWCLPTQTPAGSILRKQYNHELRQSAMIHSGIGKKWDPCLCTIQFHQGPVSSIAVSPNNVL